MKVLVACEESQAVTKELRRLGHEAYSCDIIECSGGHPEWHIMQDVLSLLNGFCNFKTCDGIEHRLEQKWDMILAFPPCTYLTVTGNRWFDVSKYGDKAIQRHKYRKDAIEFFMHFANADCKRIAIENPIGVMSTEFRKPNQVIHPYMFGDPARKGTCLWLKGLPNLIPTNVVEPIIIKYKNGKGTDNPWHMETMSLPKEERSKQRSKTFPGIAKAMAEQWAGENIKNQEREEKEMELKVNTPTFPEVIEFNFEELKQEITERASAYVNLVYTEDQIKDAKNDRAALNKFVKALSDERIKVKKECMKPYEDFEAKIKELDGIVSKAIKNIDDQLKSYEEHEKAEKLEKIKELWESIEHPAEMQFEHVFKEKFLNKSCLIGTITQYFKDDVERFKRDIATLQNLPEFSFEAVEVYKQTLDINKAISEAKTMSDIQKRKAEQERLAAEAEAKMKESMQKISEAAKQTGTAIVEAARTIYEEKPTSPLKMWVSFKALMTTEDGFALKDFFNSRGIEFESI